jgi:hypothetical protein
MPVPRALTRVLWFVALWACGVAGLALVGLAIRAVLL